MPERRRPDDGSVAVETVVLVPLLMLLLLAAVGLGRLEYARMQVDDASAAAARAASLARSADGARAAALTELDRDIGAGGTSCRHREVSVDVSGFRPGGMVKVSVQCHVDLSNLAGVGSLPLPTTLGSTSVSPVDVFREVDP
jgi:hypothetical protein